MRETITHVGKWGRAFWLEGAAWAEAPRQEGTAVLEEGRGSWNWASEGRRVDGVRAVGWRLGLIGDSPVAVALAALRGTAGRVGVEAGCC